MHTEHACTFELHYLESSTLILQTTLLEPRISWKWDQWYHAWLVRRSTVCHLKLKCTQYIVIGGLDMTCWTFHHYTNYVVICIEIAYSIKICESWPTLMKQPERVEMISPAFLNLSHSIQAYSTYIPLKMSLPLHFFHSKVDWLLQQRRDIGIWQERIRTITRVRGEEEPEILNRAEILNRTKNRTSGLVQPRAVSSSSSPLSRFCDVSTLCG